MKPSTLIAILAVVGGTIYLVENYPYETKSLMKALAEYYSNKKSIYI